MSYTHDAMWDLEVRHLRLVQAIDDEKSVTRAGARLNLTQSALSHQLRDIEEKLRTPLYLRVNKRLVLTPAGEAVLATAREVLPRLAAAEEQVARLATNAEGVLRLATQCYTTYHWLPEVMRRFNERYPRVELRVLLEATRRPMEALLEGALDVAILLRREQHKDVVFTPIFHDEMLLVVPPHHRLAHRHHVDPHELADEKLILHSDPEQSFFVQDHLAPHGIHPRAYSQVQLTEAILSMVAAGLGVTVLANWAVSRELRAGTLHAVRITRRGARRQWSAATLKGGSPRYVRDFVGELAKNTDAVITRLIA